MNARHPTAFVLVDHKCLENFLQHTLVNYCLRLCHIHLWLFLLITIACNYVIILAKSKVFLACFMYVAEIVLFSFVLMKRERFDGLSNLEYHQRTVKNRNCLDLFDSMEFHVTLLRIV
jgi:hypothetical protein